MALLTVVAAFMFQMRLDALGGLMPLVQHAGHPVSQVHNPLSEVVPSATGPLCGEVGGGSHSHSSAPSAQSGPARQAPAPRESGHGHSEHCPFCVTNAFGLEAADLPLVEEASNHLPHPRPQPRAPSLSAWRHADARAPPVL